MRQFEYVAPNSAAEAVAILGARGQEARPLAGGTDLLVQLKEGATRFPPPAQVVSLSRIPELAGIEFSAADGLRIGACTTMADVEGSSIIRERFAALAEGAGVVGSLQTMNMATIGGNLCNAAPSADTAPALLAFEAQAVIVGTAGRRTVPVEEFFRGPGQTVLAPDELLAELRIPSPADGTGSVYQRHTPRKQMDIAVVGVAVALTLKGVSVATARIALGAVAPTPIRARQAEALLEGEPVSEELFRQAGEAAAAEAAPISDTRGSAEFRRHLVQVMTQRLVAEAAARAGS
jgi:carbon-monoxide dehydrogenase medium subunit